MSYALGCRNCESDNTGLGFGPLVVAAVPAAGAVVGKVGKVAGAVVGAILSLFGGGKKKPAKVYMASGDAERLSVNGALYNAAKNGDAAALKTLGQKGAVVPADGTASSMWCGPEGKRAYRCDPWTPLGPRRDAATKYNELVSAGGGTGGSYPGGSSGVNTASLMPVVAIGGVALLAVMLLKQKR